MALFSLTNQSFGYLKLTPLSVHLYWVQSAYAFGAGLFFSAVWTALASFKVLSVLSLVCQTYHSVPATIAKATTISLLRRFSGVTNAFLVGVCSLLLMI